MSAPRETTKVPLGPWQCDGGDFELTLLVQRRLLAWAVGKALKNRDGRHQFAGGAFVLLARRSPPPASATGGTST